MAVIGGPSPKQVAPIYTNSVTASRGGGVGDKFASPCLLQQHLHREAIVHSLTAPVCRGRISADVRVSDRGPICSDVRRMAFERLPIGPHKPHHPIVESFDNNAAFVDQPMVEAAQAQQVELTGLAAVSPMVDMVRIHEAGIATAGETTALVAGL